MDHPDKPDKPDKNEERRKRVFVGKLPPDFLRINTDDTQNARLQQIAADAQTAFALQHQDHDIIGKLSVTIAQAKLVKNYGITRMDPYVTLRIGQYVYETQVDLNGGKNPKWNRIIHCRLLTGVKTIYVKIYDECSLKVDELIAWAEITIPQSIFKGEPCDDWYPLSGRQGERVEGMINLIMNFTPVDETFAAPPCDSLLMSLPRGSSYSNYYPPTVSIPPTTVPRRAVQFSLEDLKQVEEMFPNMEKDVVKSVFEANGGNKDLTVNSLLQMSG